MSYIPYYYDNLLMAAMLGLWLIFAVVAISRERKKADPKLYQRALTAILGALVSLFLYNVYILKRQTVEKAHHPVLHPFQTGSDVNNAVSDATPLHIAVSEDKFDVAKALLKAGAEVNARDKNNFTPLMIAANCGDHRRRFVDLLLASGADIRAQDNTGCTVLMFLARSGLTEAVKVAIKRGAKVNAKNDLGGTALMWALVSGKPEIVKALLEGGADPNLENADGQTALWGAKQNKQPKIVRLLQKAGAKR